MSRVKLPPVQKSGGGFAAGIRLTAVKYAVGLADVPVYTTVAGSTPVTYPVISDSEGGFAAYADSATVNMYFNSNDDTVNNPERVELVSGSSLAGVNVIAEGPLRADEPQFDGDLQNAVAALNAIPTGFGGALYIPGYREYDALSADLEITHDKITIFGDEKPSVIENSGDRGTFFVLDDAQDCTIEGINLICQGEPAAGESAFIVNDSQDLQVRNIDIDNAPSIVELGLAARSQRSKWTNIHGSMRPEADDDWWRIYDSAEVRVADCHITANSGICRAGAAILLDPVTAASPSASVDPFKLTNCQMWASSRTEVQFVYQDAGVTNMTITYDGQTTGNVAGMTAAQVKTALVALSNIGPSDVLTSGGPLGTSRVEVEFTGALTGNTERLTVSKVAGTGYVAAHPAGRAYGAKWNAIGFSVNNQYFVGFEADDTTIAAYHYRGDSTSDESRNFWIGPSRHATKGGRVFDIEHSGGGNNFMQGFRAYGHWTFGSSSKADEAFRFAGEIDAVDLHDALLLERNYTPGVDYVGTFSCGGFNLHNIAMVAYDDGDTLLADTVWRTTADVENFQIHNNPGPSPASGDYIEHYAYANDKRSRVVRDNAGQKAAEQMSASATLTLIPSVDRYVITGNTTITDISDGYAGREITLRFTASATVKSNANLILSGDLFGGAGRTLTLRSSGSEWYELSRSPSTVSIFATADQGPLPTDGSYQIDDDLHFEIRANEKYHITLILDIVGPSTTPDGKVDFNLPSGATMKWHREGLTGSNTVATAPTALSTGSVTFGLDNNESIHKFEGYITASSTAGTCAMKLAQNTPDAGSVTRKAGSMLKLERIPA